MSPAAFAIRRADSADAATLAAFAARTFAETFGPDNSPEDMAAYLAAAYGERQQRAELADPAIVTLLVESSGTLIGYAMVRRDGSVPPCVTLPSPVELWRFYVAHAWHGRGVARALMDAVLAAAGQLGGQSVWLSVWERNPRAIAFYAKCLFTDVGSKAFIVGSDRQTDRVLARALSPAV